MEFDGNVFFFCGNDPRSTRVQLSIAFEEFTAAVDCLCNFRFKAVCLTITYS